MAILYIIKEVKEFNQGDLVNAFGKIYAVEGEFHEVVPNIRLLMECEVFAGFYMDLLNIYTKRYNLVRQQINEDLIFKNFNNVNLINNQLNLQGRISFNNVSFKYNSDDEQNIKKNETSQNELNTLNEKI